MRYVKSQYFNVPKAELAGIYNAAVLQHSPHPPAQKIAADFARRIFIVLQLNNRPVRGKILLLPPDYSTKIFLGKRAFNIRKSAGKVRGSKNNFSAELLYKIFFQKKFFRKKSAR